MAQIRATLLWQKLITRRLRTTTQVGEDEIDEQMAQLRAAQGEPEVLLAEIFLAVDGPEQEEQVRQAITGIVEQIRNGAPFSEIARQFSQSASAATGGDIGWVRTSTLEKEIEAAVARTSPGHFTEPVRAVGGYYIYAVRQRRSGASGSGDEGRITLAQFLLPVSGADTEARMKAAEKVRGSVSGCDDLGRVAKELGAPPPTKAERLRLSDLAPQIRPLVAPLRTGEISAPVEIDQGLLFLMVCERETPRAPLPSREQVADTLSRQRLDLQARRYLRDLRRTAFIDVRI
jgi:peptidyl-prolyl cis-trans isomerase SurA